MLYRGDRPVIDREQLQRLKTSARNMLSRLQGMSDNTDSEQNRKLIQHEMRRAEKVLRMLHRVSVSIDTPGIHSFLAQRAPIELHRAKRVLRDIVDRYYVLMQDTQMAVVAQINTTTTTPADMKQVRRFVQTFGGRMTHSREDGVVNLEVQWTQRPDDITSALTSLAHFESIDGSNSPTLTLIISSVAENSQWYFENGMQEEDEEEITNLMSHPAIRAVTSGTLGWTWGHSGAVVRCSTKEQADMLHMMWRVAIASSSNPWLAYSEPGLQTATF
jgi:hypothetical protein